MRCEDTVRNASAPRHAGRDGARTGTEIWNHEYAEMAHGLGLTNPTGPGLLPDRLSLLLRAGRLARRNVVAHRTPDSSAVAMGSDARSEPGPCRVRTATSGRDVGRLASGTSGARPLAVCSALIRWYSVDGFDEDEDRTPSSTRSPTRSRPGSLAPRRSDDESARSLPTIAGRTLREGVISTRAPGGDRERPRSRESSVSRYARRSSVDGMNCSPNSPRRRRRARTWRRSAQPLGSPARRRRSTQVFDRAGRGGKSGSPDIAQPLWRHCPIPRWALTDVKNPRGCRSRGSFDVRSTGPEGLFGSTQEIAGRASNEIPNSQVCAVRDLCVPRAMRRRLGCLATRLVRVTHPSVAAGCVPYNPPMRTSPGILTLALSLSLGLTLVAPATAQAGVAVVRNPGDPAYVTTLRTGGKGHTWSAPRLRRSRTSRPRRSTSSTCGPGPTACWDAARTRSR